MDQKSKYVLLGSAIRLALAPFFMHAWDITTVIESSLQFLQGINPYAYVAARSASMMELTSLPLYYYGFAYLPQVLFLYAPFVWIYQLFFHTGVPIIGGHGPSLVLIIPEAYALLLALKLPVIMADAATIYLLSAVSLKAGLFYALNPYTIFITSIWGNFDPVIGFLLLASCLSFKKDKLLSGLLYSLSLMKIYTVVSFPAFLSQLRHNPKQALSFLSGMAIGLIPAAYFFYIDPSSFLSVLLFQSSRPAVGVNLYALSYAVQGVYAQSAIAKVGLVGLSVSVALVSYYVWRSEIDLTQGVVSLMLTYLVFAPVVNEQFLAAVIPIGLLLPAFNRRTFWLPLAFIAFNSTYMYFAIPLFRSASWTWDVWLSLSNTWGQLLGPLHPQVRCILGVAMGVITLKNITDICGRVGVKQVN